MTYRLWGHMMGDPEVYRTKEEVKLAWDNEPIGRCGRKLLELGLNAHDLTALEAEAEAVIQDALQFAEASPLPDPAEALTEIFA